MSSSRSLIRCGALVVLLLAAPAFAQTGIESRCHRAVLSALLKYKKNYLRLQMKCLNADNDDGVPGPGPCPAPIAAKLQSIRDKTVASVQSRCTAADLLAAGFQADCGYAAPSSAAEAACATLPVVDLPTDVTKCLMCWKEASLEEFIAVIYASHAVEECGGAVGASSTVCSELACTTPLPDQHDLNAEDTRNCQEAIAKVGLKLFLLREKYLEKCAIKGISQAECFGNLNVKLAAATESAGDTVDSKCGNHLPSPNPTFCCKCGTGNACNVHATRQECLDDPAGCEVQEGKACVSGSCDPLPGPDKFLTWWGNCPQDGSCGTPVATLDDLVACVRSTADALVDPLVCMQSQQADFCSPGGAFLDDASW